MNNQLSTNPVGRPTVMTDEVIRKLEYAFAHGATDLQACLYANIGKTALYEYQQAHPDFAERKELLKDNTTLQAKLNVAKAIAEGDKQQSTWWLEKHASSRSEFGTRTENVNLNIDTKTLLDEDKERLKQLLNGEG